jgi:hypothetical protein
MKKLILLFILSIGLCACGPNRVIVKHSSCQAQPGMDDADNCQKLKDL